MEEPTAEGKDKSIQPEQSTASEKIVGSEKQLSTQPTIPKINKKITTLVIVVIVLIMLALLAIYSGANKTSYQPNLIEVERNTVINESNTEYGNRVELQNKITAPSQSQIKSLHDQEVFTIKGTSTSEVKSLWIRGTAVNCEPFGAIIEPQNGKWELRANANPRNIDDILICSGTNTYEVTFYNTDRNRRSSNIVYTKTITIDSDVGYDETTRSETASRVNTFAKKALSSVTTDKAISTTFDLEKACENLDTKPPSEKTEFIPLTKIANSENLYAKVRGSVKGVDENLLGIGSWGEETLEISGTAILEFYHKQGEKFVLASEIPAVNGFECTFPGGFSVYYYNPDTILVKVWGGHESSPANLNYDGEQWLDLNDLLREKLLSGIKEYWWAPLDVKANKNYFSLIEQRYCCDTTYWLYPNKSAEIIFSPQTKEIADIVLHDRE